MMRKMTTKITVRYWRGTTQLEATATTYAGAMRIASRNQNACTARFCDAAGVELHDDGQGLCYLDPEIVGQVERRLYAV